MATKKQVKAQQKAIAQSQKKQANQTGLVDYGKHNKATWRKSTNDQAVRLPHYTPQQEQLLSLIQNYLKGGQLLSNSPLAGLNLPGNNQNSFEPIRQAAFNDFSQKGVPSIAERFQSLGGRDASPGALSSGPLKNQLWNAQNDLAVQLAGLEAQYGLQNSAQQSNNLQNLLGAGLQRQYDIGTIPGQQSGLRQAWNGIKQVAPQALMGGLQGGIGGALAGSLASQQGINNFQSQPQLSIQNLSNPQYQQASQNQYQQQQQYFNPNVNPMGTQDSIVKGYGQQYANQLNPQFNQFNPQEIVNSTVRGFGNRKY